MINKHPKKLGRVKETIVYGRLLRGSLIGLAVFVFGFLVLPYILLEANAANTVKFGADWGQITMTLDPDVDATNAGGSITDTGHGDVDFGTITPSENSGANYGTLQIQRRKIGVSTNGKYFTLYLSTTGDTNGLLLSNGTDTNVQVSAITDGTWETPATFTGAGWGYAVPATNIPANAATSNVYPDFGYITTANASAIESMLGDDLIASTGGSLYASSKWAPVPARANAQQIVTRSTSNNNGFGTYTIDEDTFTGDPNNTIDVYYGISVNTNVMAGTYANTIVYTVLASSQSLDRVSNNLAWDYRFGGQDDTETIAFDMTESTVNSTVTASTVHVYLVPHREIVANSYDVSSLDASDYNECTIVDGTLDVSGTTGTLQCKMPSETTYDSSITATENGQYDFWVHIDGYNYNYVSKLNEGADPAFTYVGLQTTDGSGNRLVTTMQEMTAGICKQTNRWNKLWGNAARVYDKDGYSATATPLASTAEASAAEGLGSFSLTDTRDGKKYVVRRLSDGNCWMVQNLDLELYTGMTLTADDTDLGNGTGSKDTWNIVDGTAVSGSTNTTATNVGSLSAAWQEVHKITTVRLYRGTWTTTTDEESGETTSEWTETLVTECTDGTVNTPCFASTASAAVVFPDSAGTDVASAGNQITYTVKKVTAPTGTTNYSSTNVDSLGNGATCSYTISNSNYKIDTNGVYDATNGTATSGMLLDSGGYCRIETEGETLGGSSVGTAITQYDGMSGYGIAVPNVTAVLTSGVTVPDGINATGAGGSIATSAGDYRWASNGADGAHVYDQGPVRYNNNFTGANANTVHYQTPSATSDYGVAALVELNRGAEEGEEIAAGEGEANLVGAASSTAVSSSNGVCSNATYGGYTIGTTSGSLKDPAGNAYQFVVCKDSTTGEVAADTGFAGNWYNWYAATAGSGTASMTNTDAKDSICPKGWRLPSNSGSYSFANLLTSANGYGLSSSSNKDTSLLSTPLAYIRSGEYEQSSSAPRYQGIYGWIWTGRTTSGGPVYRLSFRSEALTSSSNQARGFGHAVRCVAR